MLNFSRLFDKGEEYVSSWGLFGGIGGAIALYAFGGVTDYTQLAVIAGSVVVPSMVLKRMENGFDEMLLDALIFASPAVALWWFDALNINNAFYFTLGAMVGSAGASTLNLGKMM